jgi:hypothetical protein
MSSTIRCGNTGVMMPNASMSIATVTKTNSSAALRRGDAGGVCAVIEATATRGRVGHSSPAGDTGACPPLSLVGSHASANARNDVAARNADLQAPPGAAQGLAPSERDGRIANAARIASPLSAAPRAQAEDQTGQSKPEDGKARRLEPPRKWARDEQRE